MKVFKAPNQVTLNFTNGAIDGQVNWLHFFAIYYYFDCRLSW